MGGVYDRKGKLNSLVSSLAVISKVAAVAKVIACDPEPQSKRNCYAAYDKDEGIDDVANGECQCCRSVLLG